MLPGGTAKVLQAISLSFDVDSDLLAGAEEREVVELDDLLPPRVTLFDATPNLREVTLTMEFVDVNLSAFRLPWAQLTRLVVTDAFITFAGGHTVLRQCTNLISCVLGIVPDSECTGDVPETVLPNLQSLALHTYHDHGRRGRFLMPFVLPSLKHLKLCVDSEWCELSGEEAASLISRSGCRLERLEAKGLDPYDVHVILSSATSLADLSLDFFYNTPVDDLIFEIVDGSVVPNFHTIRITFPFAELFIELLEQGLMPSVRLMVIHGQPESANEDVKSSLARLRAQGIDVIFQFDDFVST